MDSGAPTDLLYATDAYRAEFESEVIDVDEAAHAVADRKSVV